VVESPDGECGCSPGISADEVEREVNTSGWETGAVNAPITDAEASLVNRMLQMIGVSLIALVVSGITGMSAVAAGVEDAGQRQDAPLIIGVFPRRNATLTSDLFSPLVNYLSWKLHREVRLQTAKDFPAFWEGVEAGRYDVVHYNQYHYVVSADRYRVIAHNEEFGSDTISGAIYVRRDSGIQTLEQLRGRSVLFGGGPDAMMSYIVPRYMLKKAGLGVTDFTTRFATSPPNAVLGVFYHQADAGGAGDVVIDLPMVRNSVRTEEIAIIAKSEPIVHLPWAVRRDMPEPLAKQIQQLLVTLKDSEEGRAILQVARLTGLVPSGDHDYDHCREIIREVAPETLQ
jgi:phosphonate transport system substrate-binding protein